MSNQTALQKNSDDAGAIMERVLIAGDLAKLTPNERVVYYDQVCKSVGLNPLTRPFEYMTLNGKLQLYARKDATEQLREIHTVSILELTERERDGVYIIAAKAINGKGRTDMATGAVSIQGLKGDALANAIMKTETKAKRRVTLSICGLGFLDETEVDTIPDARRVKVADSGEIIETQPATVHTFPQQPVIEVEAPPADEKPAKITEGQIKRVRELEAQKGKNVDALLAKQRKPRLDEYTFEAAEKLIVWLGQFPDPADLRTVEISTLSATQQRIRELWDKGGFTTQAGIEDLGVYLDNKGIELNADVMSEHDIPDGIGKGYALELSGRVSNVQDDPLI